MRARKQKRGDGMENMGGRERTTTTTTTNDRVANENKSEKHNVRTDDLNLLPMEEFYKRNIRRQSSAFVVIMTLSSFRRPSSSMT